VPSKKIAILISGRGSNMVALVDACRRGEIDATPIVISNKENAAGLDRARERDVRTIAIPSKGLSRDEHERLLLEALKSNDIELVCLAGYMRLLGPLLVNEYRGRILNIHPSLLPAFPGLDAQHQALEHGVKFSGCTVHFVDDGLDSGPIILQAVVPIYDDDTEETLAVRILSQEHKLYPEAVKLVLSGAYQIDGRRVIRFKTDSTY
jgi:phosphoribosylglycinamide formyltransferase-1